MGLKVPRRPQVVLVETLGICGNFLTFTSPCIKRRTPGLDLILLRRSYLASCKQDKLFKSEEQCGKRTIYMYMDKLLVFCQNTKIYYFRLILSPKDFIRCLEFLILTTFFYSHGPLEYLSLFLYQEQNIVVVIRVHKGVK